MSNKFHVGDVGYIKPLGTVGEVERVLVVQEVSGAMRTIGYLVGAELSGVTCAADWLELLEGGRARQMAQRHEAGSKSKTKEFTQ